MNKEQAMRLAGIDHFPDGWQFTPVYRNGQLAGFFSTQGAEIHCFRLESFKGSWLTHQDIERLTLPIFAEFGHLLTKVRTENLQGHAFVRRLGFHPVGADETTIHYRAERLYHARH